MNAGAWWIASVYEVLPDRREAWVSERALVQIFSMGRVRSRRRIELRSEDRIPDSGRSLVFEA